MNDMTREGYHAFVDRLFQKAPFDHSKTFTHAILGIATEITEYFCAADRVNGVEELGDIAFYVTALINFRAAFTAIPYERVFEDTSTLAGRAIDEMLDSVAQAGLQTVAMYEANELLDMAKRWVGYGKQPDLDLAVGKALALLALVSGHGQFPATTREYVNANVAKLLKRYPDALFTQERAINRDTQAERDVLEAAALG